ncbi:hypothetical protein N7I30_19950 [Aurantimonas litoralis]|nr:hypothetical protein [Aurantimonas litoralis]
MIELLGVAHLAALAAVLVPGIIALRARPIAALAGLGLLFWTDLVLTAQLLSLGGVMNVLWLYLPTSLLLGGIMSLLMIRFGAGDVQPTVAPEERRSGEAVMIGAVVVTCLIAFALSTLIGITHLPSNPDTIVYRFARVFWYLGAGSLEHFATDTDPRLVYYPTNGAMLYYPLALYRFGALWFNVPTLIAWCAVPLVTFAFARDLGARVAWAAGAAWLIALTPTVLVQAVSTNDEILAAIAMLAGLFFLHRWSRSGSLHDLVLAACGVGLSMGTKLHVYFYWPFLILLVGATLLLHRRVLMARLTPLASLRGAAALTVCVLLAVALVGSFILYNLKATGFITEHNFANQVLNTPFAPLVSLQTVAIYASQIALAPFADLFPSLTATRVEHYAAFNAFFAPLFGWVDNSAPYMSVGYRFTGVTQSLAYFMNEHTVMVGFTWIAGLMALVWLTTHSWVEGGSRWAFWMALSAPVWFLVWASSTKYIEGIGVYLGYAAVISAPALAFAFAPIAWRPLRIVRAILAGFVAVMHLATFQAIMDKNASRSVWPAWKALGGSPVSPGFSIEPSVTDELALAVGGMTHRTIVWGQPNWALMAFNPEIPQFLRGAYVGPGSTSVATPADQAVLASIRGLMPQPGDPTLNVYPFRQFPAYGHAAIKVEGKATPGLTHIGNLQFALGPEWVFASGNGVETRHSGKSDYIVLSFNEVNTFGHDPQPYLDVSQSVFGLGEGDDLEFRYDMVIDGRIVDRTGWSRSAGARLSTTGLDAGNGVLAISVRLSRPEDRIIMHEVKLRSVESPGDIP